VLSISCETRVINSVGDLNGAVDAMPRRCITIGMRQILGSKRIVLGCFRDWHRAVVRKALCGEPTALFPATLLQHHPDASVIIPASVAERAFA
jgi:glucosamine-6-phosphate deaminase